MLLGKRSLIVDQSQTSSVLTDRYQIYWNGLLYWEGFPAGTESVFKFAEEINHGIAEAAARLKGVFFIVIRDRCVDRYYALVDNSGLYHAFYSNRLAGNSFLEIAGLEGLRAADFNPEAVVEFLHFGCIYSGRTFFPSIRKIDAEAIISFQPDGRIEVLPKKLPDISSPAERSFEELLRELAKSAGDETISLDLTGGVDSRLLAVVLSYFGMPFELAGSGVAGNRDLRIAENVAEILGREFHPTYHDPEKTSWGEVFHLCDGLFDLAKADRPLQLQRDRVSRGVTLAVSGAGGELFKDFWWLQDFPLYSRPKPNLERLYAMRIAPAEPEHSLLSDEYQMISRRYRERLLNAFSSYTVAGNTQTYDRIYYAFKMREFAGRFLTNSARLLQVHAPYLDHEAARIGYGMRRSERFFNNYHRRVITSLSPLAARVHTTEGNMSVCSDRSAVLSDLWKYARDRGIRIAQKAGQRMFGKAYWQERSDHPNLSRVLREMIAARRSIERLQEHGILHDSVKISQLKSGYWGTVLGLDMLLAGLESNARFVVEVPAREHTAA
jgi:asparagine synthetase B (glutamine-hydrolysing)